MKDEHYVFLKDVSEKKNVARSARNKRTHNGKRGGVKFPSDYMTEKERNAMNSEVKSYRLNEPMSWKEFKAMPDDIKVAYVKLLREKFGVPDTYLAKMFGVSQTITARVITELGINPGKTRSGRTHWDKEGWLAWCNGAPVAKEAQEEVIEEAVEQDVPEATEEENAPVCEEQRKLIPSSGSMVFEGKVEDALNSISALLGGACVHISITWDVLD